MNVKEKPWLSWTVTVTWLNSIKLVSFSWPPPKLASLVSSDRGLHMPLFRMSPSFHRKRMWECQRPFKDRSSKSAVLWGNKGIPRRLKFNVGDLPYLFTFWPFPQRRLWATENSVFSVDINNRLAREGAFLPSVELHQMLINSLKVVQNVKEQWTV